jgi:hypothetical protein
MQSGNDEAVVSLVVDASGLRQGSTEAVALGKRIIDGLAAIKSAADGTGAGITAAGVQIVKSLGDQGRFLNQVERSLNPYAAAANKAATELNRLVGIMEKGGEAGTRAAGLIEAQAQKVLTLKTAIESASSSTQIFNQLWSQAEQILNKAISGFSGLIAKFEPIVASAQRMTGEIAALNNMRL